jgi:hypothetical protein
VTRIVGCILLLLAGAAIFLGFSTMPSPLEKIDPLHCFIVGGTCAVAGFLFLALAKIIDLLKALRPADIPQVKKKTEIQGEHMLDINLD